MTNIIGIFRNSNYTKLFFATFTSQMGGTIGLTAFTFYLLDRFSNQPAYATVTELMFSLPTLAVFFLVGVFADRLDRRKIALYCDWICAGLSLIFLLLLTIDIMPLIFGLLFVRSAIRNFFFPAEAALVQGVLSSDDYTTAAGLNQMVSSLFMLFGSGMGVFCYWTFGIEGAIAIDMICFIISGFLIKSTQFTEEIRLPNGRHTLKDLNVSLVLKDFSSGFLYLIRNKLLLTLISGFVLFGIVNGGFSVMQVFILKYKLEPLDYEKYAVILGIIFGLGVLIGSIIASVLAKKVELHHMLIIGLLISGTATIFGALVNSTFLYMCGLGIVALSLPLVNVSLGGWLPSIVDPKMMGRVQGCINPVMMFSQSLTLFLIAVFYPSIVTIEMLYMIVGSCLVLVGFFYMMILPKFINQEHAAKKKEVVVL